MTGYCTSNNGLPPVIMELARETGTNDGKGGKEQEIIKREWQILVGGRKEEEGRSAEEKERFINEDPRWKEL